MPASRQVISVVLVAKPSKEHLSSGVKVAIPSEVIDWAKTDSIVYPLPQTLARASYQNPAGKPLTKHQWDVYDFIRKIPAGKVTTYKAIADALKSGSPRSVGNALRNNPFAPFIPCHRVIASNKFVGGFYGGFGAIRDEGGMSNKKMNMLVQEGVQFSSEGFLSDSADIWDGKS